MTKDQQFFYDHAGYHRYSTSETNEQAHIRCAVTLAEAEKRLRIEGWHFEWSVSDENDKLYRWEAKLLDRNGHVLTSASHCGPCVSLADSTYRRVVEAELAVDALANLDPPDAQTAQFLRFCGSADRRLDLL